MNSLIKFLCLNALLIGSASLGMDSDPRMALLNARLFRGEEPSGDSDPAARGQKLVEAAKAGNLELVQGLLGAGAPVDAKDNEGKTPLMWAGLNGHLKICQLLLDHNAQIHAQENNGGTPLMMAAAAGHIDVCQLLLDRKAQVDAKYNDGRTPLMWAAACGHKRVCKLLIDCNARADEKNKKGNTPLVIAAAWNQKETCQLLVDAMFDRSILPSSMVAFLGIKKFHKSPFLGQIDRNIINNIASQACATAPKIKELFAQIDAIENATMRNELREYAQQQLKLKMDQKTN